MTRNFEIEKLVRDKVPEKITKNPLNQIEVEELSGWEKLKALIEKFKEEVEELDINNIKGIKSELADIQSLINASIKELSLNKEDFELLVREKDEKTGGFEKGYFLKRVSLDENDEWIRYYEKKFKEIK